MKEAFQALRTERVRLITEKAKEVLGRDIQIKISDLKEVDTDVHVDPNLNQLVTTIDIDPDLLKTLNDEELEAILNNDEIAPLPSNEEIFGAKMTAIANEFNEDKKRLQDLQMQTANKVKTNLDSKLAARRQRRARKNLDQKEVEHLNNPQDPDAEQQPQQ